MRWLDKTQEAVQAACVALLGGVRLRSFLTCAATRRDADQETKTASAQTSSYIHNSTHDEQMHEHRGRETQQGSQTQHHSMPAGGINSPGIGLAHLHNA
jgi:hypothetical protein